MRALGNFSADDIYPVASDLDDGQTLGAEVDYPVVATEGDSNVESFSSGGSNATTLARLQ